MKEERKKIVAQVAYLYFVEGLSQDDISRHLGIYRTTISRMLTKAKEAGMVKVEILGFDQKKYLLEQYLCQKYKLKGIEILRRERDEKEEDFSRRFYRTAASFVRSLIKKSDIVGLSWGESLSRMIEQMEPRHLKGVHFVPLAGGPSHINIRHHVNTLVYEMARTLHGIPTFINAIVVQENEKQKDEILKSEALRELVNYWQSMNLAVMGIGGELEQGKSQWRDLLQETDYEILRKERAVGDICCRFFDADGNPVHSSLQNRTIGVSLQDLTQIPKTIGLAYGQGKEAAILAALRKGYLKYLVTDFETMERMLLLDQDNYLQRERI